MQNKCETNSKFKTIFQKLSFICWRKEKEVNKRNRKKPSGHLNTKVLWFENVGKHEIGDAKGDKKKKKKTI